MRQIPYERLRKVWMNKKFATHEVAAILLLTETELRRLAKLHRLPHRHFVQRNDEVNDEPCAAVKAELEQRKAEAREAHMRQRRGESEETARSKAAYWRAGKHEARSV